MIPANIKMVIPMIVLVLGSAIALSSVSGASVVFANHEFATNLTGKQEVPPMDTQATGEAVFVPDLPRNETIDFWANATGIQAATMGHIHSGAQGENGPVIVTLFEFDSPQDNVTESGTIAANNLEGQMQGKTIPDLITAMKNGSMYVNFHTEKNSNGEIRGQIMSTK